MGLTVVIPVNLISPYVQQLVEKKIKRIFSLHDLFSSRDIVL